MALIYRFPGHLRSNCSRECSGCYLCHGGLFVCHTCHGIEGSLPTDCPGEPMHELVADEVYAAAIDYRASEGWIQRPSRTWENLKEK